MKHAGKIALVTGSAQGIGLACVERLHAEGGSVVILDRDGERAASEAARLGPRAMVLQAELAGLSRVAADALVARIVDHFGRLDILVNNAGVIQLQPFLDFDTEVFDRMMDINVRAPMVLGQAAARAMISGGQGGAIVNLTSVTAEVAAPQAAGYATSKGAMRQLTKVMALELIEHGIRVNAVGPGTIRTDMAQQTLLNDPQGNATVLSRTPAGRLGDPDEIAKVVSFLASDEASYVIGQTVYVDGGRLILNYTVPVRGAIDRTDRTAEGE
jgi:glucose 1-dehydrogenase